MENTHSGLPWVIPEITEVRNMKNRWLVTHNTRIYRRDGNKFYVQNAIWNFGNIINNEEIWIGILFTTLHQHNTYLKLLTSIWLVRKTNQLYNDHLSLSYCDGRKTPNCTYICCTLNSIKTQNIIYYQFHYRKIKLYRTKKMFTCTQNEMRMDLIKLCSYLLIKIVSFLLNLLTSNTTTVGNYLSVVEYGNSYDAMLPQMLWKIPWSVWNAIFKWKKNQLLLNIRRFTTTIINFFGANCSTIFC